MAAVAVQLRLGPLNENIIQLCNLVTVVAQKLHIVPVNLVPVIRVIAIGKDEEIKALDMGYKYTAKFNNILQLTRLAIGFQQKQ